MELILFLSLILNGHLFVKHNCVQKKSEIVEIGVCDLIGDCSVVLADGKKTIKNKPWIGDKVSYLKCR